MSCQNQVCHDLKKKQNNFFLNINGFLSIYFYLLQESNIFLDLTYASYVPLLLHQYSITFPLHFLMQH